MLVLLTNVRFLYGLRAKHKEKILEATTESEKKHDKEAKT